MPSFCLVFPGGNARAQDALMYMRLQFMLDIAPALTDSVLACKRLNEIGRTSALQLTIRDGALVGASYSGQWEGLQWAKASFFSFIPDTEEGVIDCAMAGWSLTIGWRNLKDELDALRAGKRVGKQASRLKMNAYHSKPHPFFTDPIT